jgi:sigma-B regulation protein RsbU (phosphoserine phosphatase)
MLVNAVRRQEAGIFAIHRVFVPVSQRIEHEREILKARKIAEAAVLAQKQAETSLKQQYQRTLLLGQIIGSIRQSLDLATIFETTVREIRQYFGADRVSIFRFDPGSDLNSGEFIAESVSGTFIPAMGSVVRERCFSEEKVIKYRGGGIQAIADIERVELDECYRELLRHYQIRANLVVPLLKEGELWGLLCVNQCAAPREWQTLEIDFIRQVADKFAIALQQADLVERLRRELSEKKQAEVKLQATVQELSRVTRFLEKLVNTDGLTGIANRRCFDESLKREWRRLCRTRQPLSLLLFDIDHFKQFNDTYGHQSGDECLIEVAQVASREIRRPADLLARYGGEEFAIILPDTDPGGAMEVAGRLHDAIRELNIPHVTSAVSDRVTLCAGIATAIPAPTASPEELIERADRALYRAKQQGRNRSAFYGEPTGGDTPGTSASASLNKSLNFETDIGRMLKISDKYRDRDLHLC